MSDRPARPLKFAKRMSDTEALMWAIERDPTLRSAFLNVTFLDRPPDFERFLRRMANAVVEIPRLRHRVVESLRSPVPEWVEDPEFDLGFHVRRIAVASPGTDRDLLDLAARLYQDALDPSRPLWHLTVVEGLEGGRAALLAKMHHTITDGVGGVRLSAMFLDLQRDPPDPEPPLAPPASDDGEAAGNLFESITGLVRRPVEAAGRTVGEAVEALRNPIDTAQSLARQVMVTDQARSPLWAGEHSMGRRFEILSASLPEVKRAAKSFGATINDVYVAAVVAGAGEYHHRHAAAADDFRVSIPISTRTDKSAGGNDFAPARVLLPVVPRDPAGQVAAVHQRLDAMKSERSLQFTGALAGLVSSLPSPLLVRFARQQVETVDFACSNVRGAPFDLYVAGAMVLANHPMGPTAGTAFNATLLSYRDNLDIGINIDTGPVDDPTGLRECIELSLAEILAAAN